MLTGNGPVLETDILALLVTTGLAGCSKPAPFRGGSGLE